MPLLVDGNNLMYALRKAGHDVGRGGVADLLQELARLGEHVSVIFDGPAPAGRDVPQDMLRLKIVYSQYRKADDVLLERIAANTAPRRLVVVSTDREIRKAAKRRDCQSVTSEDFVPLALKTIERAHRPRVREPREKRQGLTEKQAQQWLKELGMDETDSGAKQ